MSTEPPLRLATPDELAQTLSHALCWNGRKRARGGDQLMAQITAERLIEHLERCGFVVMKKPPMLPHSTSGGIYTK